MKVNMGYYNEYKSRDNLIPDAAFELMREGDYPIACRYILSGVTIPNERLTEIHLRGHLHVWKRVINALQGVKR